MVKSKEQLKKELDKLLDNSVDLLEEDDGIEEEEEEIDLNQIED